MFRPQTSIKGTSRLYEPVISQTITIEVSGRLGDPGEEPAHADQRERRRVDARQSGSQAARNWPTAPPSIPPMKTDGPNTPPLPPELIVRPGGDDLQQGQGQQQSAPPCAGTNDGSPGSASVGGMPIAPHCTQP